MDTQELRSLLEQLNSELEHTDSMDEKGRQLLRDLDAEIRGLLARSEPGTPPAPISSIQRIENAVDYFEVTHPTLSATLVKLLAVLGNAGI